MNLFDIEADGWNRVNILMQFHLIEDCSLAGIVKSQHKNFSLHVGEGVKKLCNVSAHCVVYWFYLI